MRKVRELFARKYNLSQGQVPAVITDEIESAIRENRSMNFNRVAGDVGILDQDGALAAGFTQDDLAAFFDVMMGFILVNKATQSEVHLQGHQLHMINDNLSGFVSLGETSIGKTIVNIITPGISLAE